MNRFIILDVNDVDSGFDDTVVAVVEMTPELAKTILERAKVVKQWKERDSQLLRAVYYSRDVDICAYDQELTVEEQETLTSENPVIKEKNPFEGKETERVEYMQMHIDEDDIWWRFSAKHSGVMSETRPIHLNELEKFL